jgi:hypothetical protein
VLSAADFKFVQIQAPIFTPDLKFETAQAIAIFLAQWPEYFGKIQFAGDIPPILPADVPRLVLHSPDSRYWLKAGPARLDIMDAHQGRDEPTDAGTFLSLCCDVFERYIDELHGQIRRVAGVATKFADSSNPVAALYRHFINADRIQEDWALESLSHFDLNLATQGRMGSFPINNGVKCKAGFLAAPGAMQAQPRGPAGIVIEIDINTKGDLSPALFQTEQVREFYSLLPSEFERRMDLYFPRNSR